VPLPAVRIRPESIRQAAAERPDPFSASPKGASVASAPIPAGKWLPLGPAPIGPPYLAFGGEHGGASSGRVTGLAVVPSGLHPGRVVAATAGGGIWTSDDNGAHWEPRTDGAADLAIGSVVDDPSNPNHLIAGTGEDNNCGDCYPGAGILVSTDGGQSWSLQNPGSVFSERQIAQVAIDPSNSSHEFAATDKGLFVTTNGGASWAKPTDPSYAPLDGLVSAVVINPTTPTTVYLGGGAKMVGKSTDGGIHWAAANTGITVQTSESSTALAIAASSPSTLYASVGSSGSPVALYKTTNGGAAWSRVTKAPDYTGSAYSYGMEFNREQGQYDNVLAIDPVNANHVLAGGIALVATTNGGETWSNVNGQPFFGLGTNKFHEDQHALTFRADGKVWIGDDGGVFLYTPSSGAVANANGNLDITQFYCGFNAVNGTVLAGAQDNGSSRTSSELTVPWTGIEAGDGGPSAITPNETKTQFIQADQFLIITTSAFATNAREITPPGVTVEPAAGPVAMIVVPSSATPKEPTVFYGGPDLWRTTNPAAASPTWTKVTAVGGSEVHVSAIAASPAHPNVVYVGFTNGVIQVSTDAGRTFASIELQASLNHFVTGLSVDPANPQAIAASFSYERTRNYVFGHPHAWLYSYTTTPGSGTWTTITGNLPQSAAVSRVVYDNGALVAATDQGVYATGAPAGESTAWTRVGTEMPNVQVQDLDVEPDGLYAVTHGRGAWKLPSTTAPPTVTKLKPNTGPVAGGTSVSITGANLTGATAVKFGSTAATSFKVNSATSITAVSPAETAGTVDVTVTTPGGTSAISSADHFTFVPTVTGLSPNAGSKAGGTKVTVTGTGFALGKTATIFKFGTTLGKSVNCTSTTTCAVVSPAHAAGTVDVKATVNNVSSAKVLADRFAYS
jgi:hypothetical protein